MPPMDYQRPLVSTSGEPIPAWRIGFISCLILVWELALIRFIPSEIKAISYFTNLVLFAAFCGLGLGCILQDAKPRYWVFPVGMFALFGFTFVSRGLVVYESGETIHFWLQSAGDRFKPIADIPLIFSAISYFLLIAATFYSLGHSLSNAMNAHPRLYGYGWDLLGSLCGTLVFAVTSYFGGSPIFWLIAVPLAYAWVQPTNKDSRLATTLVGLVFSCFIMTQYNTKWSPYYLINYFKSKNNLTVFVNSSFHQEAINFASKDPVYERIAKGMLTKFSLPYDVYKQHHNGQSPRKVLILGAGTGNDVFVAIKNGAQDITAVEIDPVILDLGRTENESKPYQEPDVKVILDDARHFLWNTEEKYDLIVFGTLDSQTLLSSQANLRLDNYVYTSDAFVDAKNALVSGGMIATYYSVFKNWFFSRIYSTIRHVFPGTLKIHRFEDDYLFNTLIVAAKDLPSFSSDPSADQALSSGIASTDDWPFIYIEKPGISAIYVKIMIFIAIVCLVAFFILNSRTTIRHVSPSLFLMGIGFTLLESAAIVRLSLLFGATWIVSTIVFSSALLMMFAANVAVDKSKASMMWSWPLLWAALIANIFIQPSSLLGLDDLIRTSTAALLIGIPVFCASIGFSTMFRRARHTGYALGVNLIGAMGGGAIEYLSMWLGMNSVWMIVLGIYISAFLLYLIETKQAEITLQDDIPTGVLQKLADLESDPRI
jgi:hypothetical protein